MRENLGKIKTASEHCAAEWNVKWLSMCLYNKQLAFTSESKAVLVSAGFQSFTLMILLSLFIKSEKL